MRTQGLWLHGFVKCYVKNLSQFEFDANEEEVNMPSCKLCGKEFTEGQKFCKSCGGNLQIDPETIANIDIQQKKIQQDPVNAKSYLILGDLYLENNAISLALEQYHKARAIDTKNPKIYLQIAKGQMLLENNEETISSLEKAFELGKSDSQVLKQLVLAYFKNNNWDQLIRLYESYLKNTEDIEILEALAQSHKEKGLLDESIRLYKKFISKKGESQNTLEKLAELYEENQNHVKLVETREKLFEAQKSETALFALAKAHILSGNGQKATYLIKEFETLSDDIKGNLYLSIANLSQKKFEEAYQVSFGSRSEKHSY